MDKDKEAKSEADEENVNFHVPNSYGSINETLTPTSADIKVENKPSIMQYYHVLLSLRIEPVMFLFMFSFILNTTCLTNLIMDKGCRYYYNFSSIICDNLNKSSYKNESDSVEILANNYNLYLNLLTPIGAFIVIFLAPWSDKYGRKPLLILALVGFFINDIGIVLCTLYFDSSLNFILLSNLASQITGGFICVMTIIYTHISEASSVEFRSLKYTFLQISFGLAVTLGALTGGLLYKHYHYLGVFITMAVGHFLAVIWVAVFVPETRGLDVQDGLRTKVRNLFNSQNFTSGLRVCLKRRENNGRCDLWLLLLSSCTLALTYEVYTNIAYVYAHHMYKWDPTIYSEYWAIFSFSEMIVFLIGSYIFIKVLKFSDPLIGLIGTVSIIGKNIFLAFAYQIWLYYLSNIFGFLNGMGNLAIRSLISKLVKGEESGQVFSFLATCEAIVPLLGSAIIAKIFNATIRVFPGACYIAATTFLCLPFVNFLYQFKRSKRYETLPEDVATEN